MNFIRHLVRLRARYFAVTVLILLALSSQLLHMAFNGDINIMFDENDPYLKRLQTIDKTYQQSQFLILLIQPENKQVFTPESLSMIEKLTKDSWQLPYSIRVESITNTPVLESYNDELHVDPLIDNVGNMSAADITKAKQKALADEQILDKLVSADGSAAAIIVTLALPENHLQAILEINQAGKALQKKYTSEHPGLTFYLNGDVAIEKGIIDVTMDDMMRVNPIVFTVIFLLTGILLRSFTATTATISVVGITAGLAMSLLIGLGFEINPITMMAPAIIMVLAVADSVHILTQYFIQLRANQTPAEAIQTSLYNNARPIFWTSATTAIGFLGMNFGDSPPFRAMGNMAAIGSLIAFICTYTVLPFVILLLPLKTIPKPFVLSKSLHLLSTFVIKMKSSILWGIALVAVFFTWQISKLEVNDDLSKYFDKSLEINHSFQFAKQHLKGVEHILYSFDSGEEGGVNNPEFLKKIEIFSNWLRQQSEVSGVESYANLTKKINQAMHDNDPEYHRIPDDRALISQYQLVYEMSLPQGMDLSRDISRDQSSLRLMVSLNAGDNQTLLKLEHKIDTWLNQNMPELRSQGSSQLLMFAHLGTNIIHSMIDGSLFTFAFIAVMMIFALNSWQFGLLNMIPNVIPPLVIYGMWALLVGEVNHAAAMTFSICLGLVVDDSIHLTSKYLHSRKLGHDPEQAISEAFATAGSAIVITTLTLASGIALLSLSHFTVNDTMSLMLVSIIIAALIFDLLFLPALLLACDRLTNLSATKLQPMPPSEQENLFNRE